MTSAPGREATFNTQLHPHAAAGSPAGGQFTTTSGGQKAQSQPRQNHSRAAKRQRGSLGLYSGYGRKGGDSRVKAVQQALNKLGVKDANGRALVVDGKLGPKTTSAIKAWQRKNGMQPTGKVSAADLKRLSGKKSKTAKVTKSVKAPAVKAPKSAKPAAARPTTTHISVKEADAMDGGMGDTEPPDEMGQHLEQLLCGLDPQECERLGALAEVLIAAQAAGLELPADEMETA